MKTNSQAIIEAITQNKFVITDLITSSSKEILDAVYAVQKTTDVTLDRVEAIAGGVERIQQSILEQRPSSSREYKRPPKPSTFLGESTKIFVGRKQDIETIRNYFAESNLPVAITGEGGIGKSELAYKAMHKCEDMFDLIIPIYFESILTFESFLLEMAKSLNLPIDEFEKKSLEERRHFIINNLGQGEFKHPLIYADNYETISGVLGIKEMSVSAFSKEKEEKDNARKINEFFEGLPFNTAVLLSSRKRYNLDGERPLRLDGLSETEGRDLFIELAKNHFPKGRLPSVEFERVLEEISRKTGGHPLSIELLARSYRGGSLSKIKGMLEHLGTTVVNTKKGERRLNSLQSCFEYSFNKLPQTHRDLLTKLILFNSPFPPKVVNEIMSLADCEILWDLYDHSLLRRMEFDEYGNDIEEIYHVYYFHPAIRRYLEHKIENKKELEEEHGVRFSRYYLLLLKETYDAIGTQVQALSLQRFDSIWRSKNNDFDRGIILAKDPSQASAISTLLGLILFSLHLYSESLNYHRKSLAVHEKLKDKVGMAADYTNIGNILDTQGNHDQALQYHKKALAIDEEMNDRARMAARDVIIGAMLHNQGNYGEASQYHKKALAVHEELKDRVEMSGDYAYIGLALIKISDRNGAIDSFSKGLEILEELEKETGDHHPSIDVIQTFILKLQKEE